MYRISMFKLFATTIDVYSAERVHVVKSTHHKEPGRHNPDHPWDVVIADPHGLMKPWWIHYRTHAEALAFATRFAQHSHPIERQYA